jgi:hypothetical protein
MRFPSIYHTRADSCQVKFDSAAAASMSSAITSRHCSATRRPGDSCPFDEDKSAAAQLNGGAAAALAAIFGVTGYSTV